MSAGPQRDHAQRSAGRLPEQTLTLPCHWEWNENRESVPLGVKRNTAFVSSAIGDSFLTLRVEWQ